MKESLINIFILYLLVIIPVALPVTSLAQEFPPRPRPPRLVNDLSQVMTASQQQLLERKLVAYNDSTSTQITIVTMNSVGSYDISDYSFKLAEQWGIGQKGKDNGILILAATEDRAVFIATGYGLEDVVPDALAKRIVENYILPNFREGNYYQGFNAATDVIIGLATGKFTGDDIKKREPDGINIFTVIIIILIIIVSSFFRRRKHYGYSGHGRTVHHGGFFGGRGGFGGGGGGGGGFGGFGGGSFGGGGAGGRW